VVDDDPATRDVTAASARAAAFILATVLALVALVPGADAAPGTSRLAFTLRLDRGAAPLIAGRPVGTLSQAIRVVGPPAKLVPLSGATPTCRTSWPALGLTIDFETAGSTSCTAGNLDAWAQVTATGRRWHTTAGLHVGDTERRLHALYPAARQLDFLGKGRIWELETGGPFCDGGPPLSLGARARSGRITALTVLHVPACG
jgi:hypothetical protein